MRTNYILKSVLTLAFFTGSLFSFQLKGEVVQVGDIAYNLNDELQTAETAVLPGGAKYSGALVIPASIEAGGKNYAVVKIGDGSLRDAPGLTSVVIPEGLKTIGNSSFASCTGITSIILPASVNAIEDWAFYGCSAMTSINIPSGITTIGEHTFQNSGLTSITLPSTVTSLKTCAFQDAAALASINLENVTEIGAYSLLGTAITSATIGNVFSIKSEAFKNCTQLADVNFTGSVSIIEDWAFQNSGINSLVLPEGMLSLGSAFPDCANLSSVTIPKSIKILKDWTFSSTAMEEMNVSWDAPQSVTVAENAFGNVTGTPEWKVPANLKSLYGEIWNGFPVVSVNPTGIEFVSGVNTTVYYADGVLNLSNLLGHNVSVVSIDGRVITRFQVTSENAKISLSLSSGIYLLYVADANKQTAIKFIAK